jgi:hypothetical protein
MEVLCLLVVRNIRELSRSAAFRILIVLLVVLAFGCAAGTVMLITVSETQVPETTFVPHLSGLVGMALYFSTLLPFIVFIRVFAGAVLLKEKVTGQLETLLATPVRPKTLWLSETITVFLPGIALAFTSSLLLMIAITVGSSFRPGIGDTLFSVPLFTVCWAGNPLFSAGLCALTVIIALKAGPDMSLIPSFIGGFGLMTAIPAGTAVRIIDLSSWTFASGYLGIVILEWIAVFLMVRNLEKERIVLSGRAE